MVISYRHFGTTYRSHLQGSRIQKESWLSEYTVYVGKSVGGEKFSVVRCQPIVLMQVVISFSSPSSFSFSLSFIAHYYVPFVSRLCTQYFYHIVSLDYGFYPLLLFCFCIFLFTPIYFTDFYLLVLCSLF